MEENNSQEQNMPQANRSLYYSVIVIGTLLAFGVGFFAGQQLALNSMQPAEFAKTPTVTNDQQVSRNQEEVPMQNFESSQFNISFSYPESMGTAEETELGILEGKKVTFPESSLQVIYPYWEGGMDGEIAAENKVLAASGEEFLLKKVRNTQKSSNGYMLYSTSYDLENGYRNEPFKVLIRSDNYLPEAAVKEQMQNAIRIIQSMNFDFYQNSNAKSDSKSSAEQKDKQVRFESNTNNISFNYPPELGEATEAKDDLYDNRRISFSNSNLTIVHPSYEGSIGGPDSEEMTVKSKSGQEFTIYKYPLPEANKYEYGVDAWGTNATNERFGVLLRNNSLDSAQAADEEVKVFKEIISSLEFDF